MVMRKDLNLEALGKVAECQPDGSPIEVGTAGQFEGKTFQVVGRIQLTYGEGFWNEWSLLFSDGNDGWLGEALGQYFVSFEQPDPSTLGSFRALTLGAVFDYGGELWAVTDRKKVKVSAFEGELPSLIRETGLYSTVDLRNSSGEGLTVDFSGTTPTLYRGRWLTFAELGLSGLKRPEDPSIAVPLSEVRSVKCGSCGAPHEMTAPGRSQVLVCQYCDAAMDAQNPELKVLDQLMARASELAKSARIPIGTTAQLPDGEYRVIGMMENSTKSYGQTYFWKDYLLYNHLTGYRWINESQDHFTLFEQLYALPKSGFSRKVISEPSNKYITVNKEKYLHFSTAEVTVERVVGEFYWRVKKGDKSRAFDYVKPPGIVSASVGPDDITWTRGTYLSKGDLEQIFPTLDLYREPLGVGTAQPNPYVEVGKAIRRPVWIALAIAIAMVASGLFLPSAQPDLAQGSIRMALANPSASTFAGRAKAFKIPGVGRRDLAVTLSSDVKNGWITCESVKVAPKGYRQKVILADWKGKAVKQQTVVLKYVSAGKPVALEVIAKKGPRGKAPSIVPKPKERESLSFDLEYKVSVLPGRRNWMGLNWFWFLLLFPWLFLRSKRNKFEKKRWYESDYG